MPRNLAPSFDERAQNRESELRARRKLPWREGRQPGRSNRASQDHRDFSPRLVEELQPLPAIYPLRAARCRARPQRVLSPDAESPRRQTPGRAAHIPTTGGRRRGLGRAPLLALKGELRRRNRVSRSIPRQDPQTQRLAWGPTRRPFENPPPLHLIARSYQPPFRHEDVGQPATRKLARRARSSRGHPSRFFRLADFEKLICFDALKDLMIAGRPVNFDLRRFCHAETEVQALVAG